MIESFPLDWPIGYKRSQRRITSKFKQGMETSQRFLRNEIKRLAAHGLIVSTNIPIRKDGGMYTEYMSKRLPDPGVAIFFRYKDKPVTMCCDQYERVWENIYALGKAIEAIRGMERWGVSDIIERTFTGFKALPEAIQLLQRSIWEILGLQAKPVVVADVHSAYKRKVKECHPDTGGSVQAFQELQEAYRQAQIQFN